MESKRVKIVSYVRRNNEVLPREKVVLEKLEEDCYRSFVYAWDRYTSSWIISRNCGYYDGEKLNHTGSIFITDSDIGRKFELLVKYGGYVYMQPDEENTDTTEELKMMEKVNKSMEDK